MTLIFLIAGLLVSQDPNDQAISATIDAPESIIPALAPYVDCLNNAEERLSQRAGPMHAAAMRGVVDEARRQCAKPRAKAHSDALQLIAADTSVAESDRTKVVDAALANVDASDDAFLAELERREKAERGQK